MDESDANSDDDDSPKRKKKSPKKADVIDRIEKPLDETDKTEAEKYLVYMYM